MYHDLYITFLFGRAALSPTSCIQNASCTSKGSKYNVDTSK